MSDNDEIKEQRTKSVRHKAAFVLMTDGVSFSNTEGDGTVFATPT